jgi:hypothetical protein
MLKCLRKMRRIYKMAGKVGRPKKNPEGESALLHTEEGVKVLSPEEAKAFEAIPKFSTPDREPIIALTDNAYSITRDPETQAWVVVKISYDLRTGTVGKIEVVEKNTERQIVIERFQILAGQEFMSS